MGFGEGAVGVGKVEDPEGAGGGVEAPGRESRSASASPCAKAMPGNCCRASVTIGAAKSMPVASAPRRAASAAR